MYLIADNAYRRCNLGRGRYIPFYNKKIYVHKTVKERIQKGYQPKAHNWDTVAQSPMLQYVSWFFYSSRQQHDQHLQLLVYHYITLQCCFATGLPQFYLPFHHQSHFTNILLLSQFVTILNIDFDQIMTCSLCLILFTNFPTESVNKHLLQWVDFSLPYAKEFNRYVLSHSHGYSYCSLSGKQMQTPVPATR